MIAHRMTATEIATACGQAIARELGLKGKFRVTMDVEVQGDRLLCATVSLFTPAEQHAPSPDYRIEVKP